MADRYVVAMLMLHFGTPRDQEARRQLADALPPGSEVAEPDEVGVFEVHVDAGDYERALNIVWDAGGGVGHRRPHRLPRAPRPPRALARLQRAPCRGLIPSPTTRPRRRRGGGSAHRR
jgi:hypothetical protein